MLRCAQKLLYDLCCVLLRVTLVRIQSKALDGSLPQVMGGDGEPKDKQQSSVMLNRAPSLRGDLDAIFPILSTPRSLKIRVWRLDWQD